MFQVNPLTNRVLQTSPEFPYQYQILSPIMTRSHKANDPVHGVEPQGAQDSVPRNFGKHATHTERAKKNGGGKANW